MTGDDRPADSSSTHPRPDGTGPSPESPWPATPGQLPTSPPSSPTGAQPAAGGFSSPPGDPEPGSPPAFGPPGQAGSPLTAAGASYGQVTGPSLPQPGVPPATGDLAGQQPAFGSGPAPAAGYPSGQPGPSTGQRAGSGPPPAGSYPLGQQPYGSGATPPASYPSGQQPYGSSPPAAGGYPSGQQPYGPGATPPGGYPSGQQPYGSGPAPADGYPSGQQPYGSGAAPVGGYPSGQQPYGSGQGPAASGQQPVGGYPSGQQPAGYQSGPYGLGQPPGQPGGQYFAGGQPPGAYQAPGGWPAGAAGYPGGQPDYLGSGYPASPVGRPPRRRRRALWAVVASATAVALTAGGVTAYTLLAGSGVTLDTQLPGDSVAYAEVNLDPPAGQKVAALRFFHHFADLHVQENSPDLLEGLFEPLLDSPDTQRQYRENIKPWVGKHAAVAVDPQGDRGEMVVVIEATDTGKASTGLDTMRRQTHEQFGYVIKDKIVVLASSAAVAQAAVTAAGNSSLHDNKTFQGDVKSVGDGGILTAWADLAHLDKLTGLTGLTGPAGLPGGGAASGVDLPKATGRAVASLKFTDNTADVVFRTFGTQQVPAGEAVGPRLGTLPEDTAIAVALSGGDRLVKQAYQQLKDAGLADEITSVEKNLGMSLPDDLAALVGSTTVVAVGGSSGAPAFGAIAKTADVDRAKTAAEKVSNKIGESRGLTVRSVGDSTVFASSPDYASKLAGNGGLGNSDLFKSAMPELAGAQFAVYVDVHGVGQLGGGNLSGPGAQLRAFGLTATTQGSDSTVHLRLVV
ncbi:MAG: hypothetical protein V7637_5364 [Mycobacteriales bacterium]